MPRIPRRLVFLLAALGAFAPARVAQEQPLAFVDVHVVPMDTERVLRDHIVLVRDGRIAALGPARDVEVPADCRVVEGMGRYLLPGLADMHVHIGDESDLLLNLAAGVTTVRNLWGTPLHLEWQERLRAGSFFGPTVYTTGPIVDGVPPSWDSSVAIDDPDLAFAEVERQRDAGYPAIKVYSALTEEVYVALLDAAHELGLRVTGHVPRRVGLITALEARQDCIEHLEGYLDMASARPVRDRDELVARTVEAETWNCPTLVVMRNIALLGEPAILQAPEELRFVNPLTRASWDPTTDFRFRNMDANGFAAIDRYAGEMRGLVGALHEGGARLLCGTDTPNPYVIPGFAVHDELELLVAAGLSPYEALRAATVDAAEYLGQPREFGRVAVGMRADLLLLEGDPLADIAHTRERAGVLVRGEWLSRAELTRRLDELVASYEAGVAVGALALPEEGAAWLEGRYELRYNDVPAGAERVAVRRLEGGRLVVLARAALAAAGTQELRLELRDDLGPARFTFVQEVAGVTLRIAGVREGDRLRLETSPPETVLPAEVELADGAALSVPSLGSWQALALRLRDLAPGTELHLEQLELRGSPAPKLERRTRIVRARASTDGDPTRSFVVRTVGEAREIALTTDGDGRLRELHLPRQIGRVSYVLVEED